jgi:DNA-binding FadR family transcriptional regulator
MTTSSPTTTAAGEKIGVPECDEYLAKYEACLAKLPAAAKEQYDKAFEQVRKSWQTAASTPQGKAGLAAGCKQATEMAKTSMKSFNCEF